MSELIDDETLARLVKHQREEIDSPAHRTMLVNVLWTVGQIDTGELPELSPEEVDEIIAELPTDFDQEDEF